MALSKIETQALDVGQIGGRRNLIINGSLVHDQRNSGSETIPAGDTYTLDRFRYNASQASKFKVQQNAQAITPPEGFSKYLGVTVNATHTVASTDNFFLTYFVEGYDSAQLDFGKATAKTVTLSFYVQSSLTGTFSGSILNSAENRSYPYTYTISSADTWERKTITIAGDTSGTWIGATNGKGLMLTFSLGMGSNFTGTAGQWNAAQDFAATGETVKLVENASAEWKITGVQLEVGSVATPFEHRSYGEELALCERYYQGYNFESYSGWPGAGRANGNPYAIFSFPLRTTMRTAPAGEWLGTNNGMIVVRVSDGTTEEPTSIAIVGYSENAVSIRPETTDFATGTPLVAFSSGGGNLMAFEVEAEL